MVKIFNERYSGRSYSEVRKPRQPSTVRSISPTNTKLNGKIETNNNSINTVKSNDEHSSRTTSRVNSSVNGLKQKQPNNAKLINDLENLSINKPNQINNTQKKTVPTDLLS